MATTNHERVGKSLEVLNSGIIPFIERELHAQLGDDWQKKVAAQFDERLFETKRQTELIQWDTHRLLGVMWNYWNDVFGRTLGHAERSLVSELRDIRNRWAHQEPFSSDDAYRALDSVGRLLMAVSAPQADEIEKMKMELLRVRFDEQVRTEKRRSAGTVIDSHAGNLKPWRSVQIVKSAGDRIA